MIWSSHSRREESSYWTLDGTLLSNLKLIFQPKCSEKLLKRKSSSIILMLRILPPSMDSERELTILWPLPGTRLPTLFLSSKLKLCLRKILLSFMARRVKRWLSRTSMPLMVPLRTYFLLTIQLISGKAYQIR